MNSKLIVVLACLLGAALAEKSPVLTWGSNSPLRPYLSTISEDDFAEMMKPLAKDTMILTFLANGLRREDFGCKSSPSRATCFSNLAEATPKTYYGSVENPLEALRKVTENRESVTVDGNGKLEREIECQLGKEIIIDLSNIDEGSTLSTQSNQVLEKQDGIMGQVYEHFLAKGCKITAIYTSSPSSTSDVVSKSRTRRAAADKATSGTMFRSNKDFLIFWTDLIVREEQEDKKWISTPITISDMTLPEKNETSFSVNLNGGNNKLSFLISLNLGYFKLSNLMLNNQEFYVPSELTAPTDFSYSCGNLTLESKQKKLAEGEKPEKVRMILWNSLQMQAPFNNETSNDFKFGDAWYCVGFFSSGILAGLFVVFILLGIMSVGICWMLDINTMDRFDDPKGKTITINVNE
ncbi:V-type proton ATPase subunit S1 [Episyrphus balteatus]|uniref:V-type proton ATPase subunit S1 n=1 Tax=Episyrphus balteatus TaxID=286459 RepID=UPI0024861287|nr:V-type proton ATPase subunit S1 [Episyrphus balteatus]